MVAKRYQDRNLITRSATVEKSGPCREVLTRGEALGTVVYTEAAGYSGPIDSCLSDSMEA